MTPAFRICQRQHAKGAFAGEGSRLYGGRWNSPGVRVVYLAGSVALAQLEVLVHLESDDILHSRYVVIPVRIPPRDIMPLPAEKLPRNWRAAVTPATAQRIGDDWVREGSSLALRVPSVVVPQEWNYLINPAHPAFARLEIGKAQPLTFDPRLA